MNYQSLRREIQRLGGGQRMPLHAIVDCFPGDTQEGALERYLAARPEEERKAWSDPSRERLVVYLRYPDENGGYPQDEASE